MGSCVVLNQILHWTVRNVTSSGKWRLQAPNSSCRMLCSSSRTLCSSSMSLCSSSRGLCSSSRGLCSSSMSLCSSSRGLCSSSMLLCSSSGTLCSSSRGFCSSSGTLCSSSGTLCSSSRRLCSSSSRHQDLAALSRKAAPELSQSSLAELGFTEAQSEQILQAVSSLKRGSVARDVLSSLTVLLVLGFNCSSVLKLLEKCPELYMVKEAQLQQRVNNLRKLGLKEGSLQRTVAHYPNILMLPVKTVKSVVDFLREKCLFTSQQLAEILRDSPAVTLEDLDQLEYKFQYVYFRMGVKQADMVKFRLFRFPLDEVRCRHTFLERRGFYQTPDKKGQTAIINPRLDAVLHSDLDPFLTQLAQASGEEYHVFQKLLPREWKEEELQLGKIQAEREEEEEEDEEEEEEDEETTGKGGYVKRRKR